MRRSGIFLMVFVNFFNFLAAIVTLNVNSTCDFYQNMVLGQTYYIYNQEYPQNYPAYRAVACRWIGKSPINTNIVITCNDIQLPESYDCRSDRLAVSLSGDADFNDAHNYCGTGKLTLVTEQNMLAVGLFAQQSTYGGRFSCSLTAIQNGPPTTTTETPTTCDCGWRRGLKIAGGEDAEVNEFPFMAYLWNTEQNELGGGASILSERYALTAVHVVLDRQPSALNLIVGDHNISSNTDTPYAAAYRLIRFIIHPEYENNNQWNDIAIVVTEQPILFSYFVGPICLPFRYTTQSFVGQSVLALGWGNLEFLGADADTLQKVELSIIQNDVCDQAMDKDVTLKQICTYGDKKDECSGDSGGPVIWQDPNTRRLQLIGVISYGYACAQGRPGVNTRVTSYLNWIMSQTGDTTYCIK